MYLPQTVTHYLEYCHYQKKLNEKTVKAYGIDLKQFLLFMQTTDNQINRINLTQFIVGLHKQYKAKSVKRKIASLKAFFCYLEYEDILVENPFNKINIKFREPFTLPRTIAVQSLKKLFSTVYHEKNNVHSINSNTTLLRNIAVIELLFATGLRVSELCFLTHGDIDLLHGTIKIMGKGAKERIVHISNPHVIGAMQKYVQTSSSTTEIKPETFFFLNRRKNRLSDQSVRFMIRKYAQMAGLAEHITPHMFRHTFATLLLEEDVDIRYIQQILGHSSIITTQIYTHVTSIKQRDILSTKHPRNKIEI